MSKPNMRAFTRLNKHFIQKYKRYLPTAFDESMSLLEKVNKVIEGLNTIVRHINDQSETLEEWQTDLLDDLDTTLDDYVNELTTLKQSYETFREDILDDILPESTTNILTEWLNDGTLEQIINENVFNMKADKTYVDEKLYRVNTKNDLKNEIFKSGDIVETNGFYNIYDRGQSTYEIKDSTNETINDINIIQIDNGLYAELISKGGITPQQFGIIGNENEVESIEKWEAYLKYVHDHDDCHFKITYPINGRYELYKPLIIKKSFIGEHSEDNPTFMFMTSVSGTPTASPTEKTDVFDFTFDVKAVISFKTPNLGNRYEFSNFKVDCGDDDDLKMDYGVYIPETTRVSIEGIRVNHPQRIGIYVLSTWVSSMRNCEVYRTRYRGFVIGSQDIDGGQPKTGTSTSFDISSLYVNRAINIAYKIYGLQYSNISSLAADSVRGDDVSEDGARNIYNFELCKGLTLNSLGMENVKARTLIIFNGCGGITINSPYFLNIEYERAIISIDNHVDRYNGSFTINNPSFMDGLKGYNGTPEQSYYFNSKSLVTFNGDSTWVILDDESEVITKFGHDQTEFYENTIEHDRKLIDGQWNYTVTVDRNSRMSISEEDISAMITITDNTKISDLVARKYGGYCFISFWAELETGSNSSIITSNLRPITNVPLNVYHRSNATRDVSVNTAITPTGDINISASSECGVIISGFIPLQ